MVRPTNVDGTGADTPRYRPLSRYPATDLVEPTRDPPRRLTSDEAGVLLSIAGDVDALEAESDAVDALIDGLIVLRPPSVI